jgi:hypothetical protein
MHFGNITTKVPGRRETTAYQDALPSCTLWCLKHVGANMCGALAHTPWSLFARSLTSWLVCHRLLVALKESNRAAFIALLQQDLEGLLPLVYTPVIAEACLRWGTLLPRPLGLYVGPADDPTALVTHWPSQEVRARVLCLQLL